MPGQDTITRPLPDLAMYRAMASGHVNRIGHPLRAHLESCDGGQTWAVVRECCTEGQDRT